MATSWGEPTNLQEAINWVERHSQAADRFRHLAEASDRHRAQHRCGIYPSSDAQLLGVLAAASGARRVMEIGCGLGYSALWLAYGAGGEATVETIESDQAHAGMARGNFAAEGGWAIGFACSRDGPPP